MLLDGFKRHPEAVGVGGSIEFSAEEMKKSAISRYLNSKLKKFQGEFEILSNNPLRCFSFGVFNTANIAYKKEVLESIRGFNTKFYWPGSEDNDLAFRITLSNHFLLYIPFYVLHSKDMNILDFLKIHFRRGANGYLLRMVHYDVLERMKPGFVKNYGSVPSFIAFLLGSEKFFAFFDWFSLNVGIMYMKSKLVKQND